MKTRVLILTRNLPPLRGGMERLNLHIIRELAQEFDVRVCGPAGCASFLPEGVLVTEAPLRPLNRFLMRNILSALAAARAFRPHIVLAGSGVTAPAAWAAARLCGAQAVAYLHGLDIVADHWLYRTIWRPLLRRLDTVIVNSRHTAELAATAGIDRAHTHIIHPGVELTSPDPAAATAFRERFNFGDRPLLLSLGRLTARKGLAEFIEKALPDLVTFEPSLKLVIIGDEATDALKPSSQSQRERIRATAVRMGLEPHICLLGVQDDASVCGAFFASNALVFPVLDIPGDVEGFGMVAVEAAAHGLPSFAFRVGGVSDAVNDPESGRLLQAGDYAGMVAALRRQLLEPKNEAAAERCRQFASRFAWPAFGARLRTLCRSAERVQPGQSEMPS